MCGILFTGRNDNELAAEDAKASFYFWNKIWWVWLLIILIIHAYGEVNTQESGPEQSHVNVNIENWVWA